MCYTIPEKEQTERINEKNAVFLKKNAQTVDEK